MNDLSLSVGDSFTAGVKVLPRYKQVPPYTAVSSDSGVASVDGEEIKAVANGTASVSVTATAAGKVFSDSIDVTVGDIVYENLASTRTATGIVIARKTDEIEVGEEYSVQAYVLSEVTAEHPYPYGYADDNLVVWESSNPSVCRVKNGVLTGVATGVATITAYDLAKTAHESFAVQVVAESALSYTDNEVLTLAAIDIDTTDSETTTVAIQTILANAHENGYKKVVFPANQLYYVSPVYGTISIPTQMIADFNGSVIQIEESSMTQTGYVMFQLQDCYRSEIRNATIYGERYLITGTGKEGCRSVVISGASYRAGLRNCTVSNSPGFNIGFWNTNRKVVGFPLSSIEAGGIDDNGQDISLDYSYRGNSYINISNVGSADGKIALGNVQGYGGYLYMSARMYDIFFYDANKNFISSLKNCVQFYRYTKPANAVYCRIAYRYNSAPTSSDPDYHAIAHVYSNDKPERCFLKNCTFENNYSTAVAPNGGESMLIDNCYFANNGYRDPASHIDWEDGRQDNKGHILRNCRLVNGGPVTLVGADGTVIHNNVLDRCNINIGGEVQNSRVWLNQFIGKKTSVITTKTDMVFSQNYGYDGATYTVTNVSNVGFAVRESENGF